MRLTLERKCSAAIGVFATLGGDNPMHHATCQNPPSGFVMLGWR
jgi:hypothetical protein